MSFSIYRLTLSKHFSPKFIPSRKKSALTHRWCVAGDFDYADIDRFESLEKMSAAQASDHLEVSGGAIRHLLLFPFRIVEPESDNDLSSIKWETPSNDSGPFLITVLFNISAGAIEAPRDFTGIEGVIAKAGSLILSSLKDLKDARYEVFRTFGGPELALVSILEKPTQIKLVSQVLKNLSDASASMIADVDSGHAFSSIQPIFCFNSRHESLQSPHVEDAGQPPLKFRFKAHVECGHEQVVTQRIRSELIDHSDIKIETRSAEEFRWGQPEVHGEFTSPNTLCTLWNRVWFDPEFREHNLLSTETTLSLPVEKSESELVDGGWKLRESVLSELEDIFNRLRTFADHFLELPQKTELLSIFHSYRACFFRHELVAAARDLLPFFKQISAALTLEEMWKKFIADEYGNAESIADDFSVMLAPLARAVRNRIECRSSVHDTPIPPTIDFGACKIVSAYNVIFYLCWEMIRRQRGVKRVPLMSDDDGAECTAHGYAACIQSGIDGKMVVHELFEKFREFVEKETRSIQVKQQIESSPQNNPWSARLLLLDISGRSQMRPEITFVHCLHEAAEISEWVTTFRLRDLRKMLMNYSLYAVGSYLAEEVEREISEQLTSTNGVRRKLSPLDSSLASTDRSLAVMREFATALLEHCLEKRYQNYLDVLVDCHPEQVPEILFDAYSEEMTDPELTATSIQQYCDSTNPRTTIPESARYFLPVSTKASRSLKSRVEQLKLFLRELTADLGMIAGLANILKEFGGRQITINDVCHVFQGLFILYEESRSDHLKTKISRDLLLSRWVVQARAISPDGYRAAVIASIAHLNRLRPGVGITSAYADQFIADQIVPHPAGVPHPEVVQEILAAFLFEPNEKKLPLFFPEMNDFDVPEQTLLKQFVAVWESSLADSPGLHANRCEMIWSFWAKSCRMRYNSALEPRQAKK